MVSGGCYKREIHGPRWPLVRVSLGLKPPNHRDLKLSDGKYPVGYARYRRRYLNELCDKDNSNQGSLKKRCGLHAGPGGCLPGEDANKTAMGDPTEIALYELAEQNNIIKFDT